MKRYLEVKLFNVWRKRWYELEKINYASDLLGLKVTCRLYLMLWIQNVTVGVEHRTIRSWYVVVFVYPAVGGYCMGIGRFWLLFALSSGAIAFCSAQHHPEQLRDRWEESFASQIGWLLLDLWSSFQSPSESGLLPKAAVMWCDDRGISWWDFGCLNFQTGLRSGGIFVSLVNYPRKFFCLVKLINIYQILTRRERGGDE